jgi:uncharacterized protein
MDFHTSAQGGISDSDLDELGALLELRAVPFKGMSLEMLDGFLSSLVVAPDLVLPSEWTPRVWGGRPPRWETIDEAGRVHQLLMGLWNDVARRVAIDPERLRDRDTPLIALHDGDASAGNVIDDCGVEWAMGFLDGVELREEAWGAACAAEEWIDDALIGIEAIAIGEWPPTEPDGATEPLTVSERLDVIFGIPHMLHDLNLHRLEQTTSRTPIRKETAPGRNDPCPCGSGRKFKKCCGTAANLH